MTTATLNKRRVSYANNNRNKYRRDFNCWGATLFTLGQRDRLRWVDAGEMVEWLENNTRRIYRPARPGDVLVVTSWGLAHTAVYLGNGKYFHKRGHNTAEITDLKGVRTTYGGHYSWRRCELTERQKRALEVHTL